MCVFILGIMDIIMCLISCTICDLHYISHVMSFLTELSTLFYNRFGKFLVFDMMQVDMMEVIENRLEEIEKNLFKTLVDHSLIKNDR